MKRILVRIDDICPTMNFQLFQRSMELMDQYNVKPLIGVIPDCQDQDLQIEPEHPEFWDFVKELQNKGYTIAMHGLHHVFDNCARGIVVNRWDSEFAGHSYDTQVAKILKGKEILASHGIHTDVFFAPGHSYDENTLKALATCGFRYMSDGMSAKPYEWRGVICIPARSAGMPKLAFGTTHTAVFHVHEWTRDDKMYCQKQFIDLIENHNMEILPWEKFIDEPIGNRLMQRAYEKVNVFKNRYIKPLISRSISLVKRWSC